MAGSTCLRNLGWRRIVRIVTIDARLERIVQAFDDLREAGWSRGQIFVTGEAGRSPLSRNQRRLGLIVLAVNGRRSMAHLTRQGAMVGAALDLALLVVTVEANPRTGVVNRQVGGYHDRLGSVMPQLAEGLGYKADPDSDQHSHRCRDKKGQSDNLVGYSPASQIRLSPGRDPTRTVFELTSNTTPGTARRSPPLRPATRKRLQV
jgi:hypothetical protein